MPISSKGWELYVKRLGLQHRAGERIRTYGRYQVFIEGVPDANLSGFVCESTGPGDNTAKGTEEALRICQGRYALSTQFGPEYRSVGYTDRDKHPMPGFALLKTGVRLGILVHPGHRPYLYLSSIGCFNLTKPLKADEYMSFQESQQRVIAMIESLRQHDPDAFASDNIGQNTAIANAFIVVDGEPMIPVSDEAIA
jgi:hypothetical protein